MCPSVTCGWTFIGILRDMSLATRQGVCQMLYPTLMYGRAKFSKPTCYKIVFLDSATFLPILIYKKNGTISVIHAHLDTIFQTRKEVGGIVYLILEGKGRSSIGMHTTEIFAGFGSCFWVLPKHWAALQDWRLAGGWKAMGMSEQVAIHVLSGSSCMKCQQLTGLQTRI